MTSTILSQNEADENEAAVEHWSTTTHRHVYAVCAACKCGLSICVRCGGWQERIEGRYK